ncbi:intestinal mucin-like protein [Sardina pilchardus]|uniref:intestinal mucin-like protein n=1 Tax=Sardina pilchardus TaxID=27697 RepID=UPI002E15B04B
MTFEKHTVAVSIRDLYMPGVRLDATLDGVYVNPNYEEHGIRFESTILTMTVYIDKVGVKVSLDTNNKIVIMVGHHFRKNTEGQCGDCGGSSCVRPGGQIENDYCCPQTAYDWITPNPSKPQCASAPRNQSCSPSPPPPPPPCPTPICDLLKHPVFEECRQLVDLAWVEESCRFDECHLMPCPSMALAADMCKQRGFCVEWRSLTNGSCSVSCPDGMVYQECRDHLDDHCNGSLPVSGRDLEDVKSGCFCPEPMLRARENSYVCVDTCTESTTAPPTTYTTALPTTYTTAPPTTFTTAPPTTYTTAPPTTYTTAPPTTFTTAPPTTYTTAPPTTICKPCVDPQTGKTWPCGATWEEKCSDKTCDNGRIFMTPVACPHSPVPDCPNGRRSRVRDGCCHTYKCDCVCTVSGDPHYRTFSGTYYDFQGDCTYTLVQELLPQQQLSIVVDNFYCFRPSTVTCAKGIVMKFRNHTVSLAQQTVWSKPTVSLNMKLVTPPHWEDGLRFETSGNRVSVYMEEIRSHVSMEPAAHVTITLAMEHFQNNVEGQCGE